MSQPRPESVDTQARQTGRVPASPGCRTVKGRIVACAVKQIIEPLFEAKFSRVSYGFRPGRSCHGALEHIRVATSRKRTGW